MGLLECLVKMRGRFAREDRARRLVVVAERPLDVTGLGIRAWEQHGFLSN